MSNFSRFPYTGPLKFLVAILKGILAMKEKVLKAYWRLLHAIRLIDKMSLKQKTQGSLCNPGSFASRFAAKFGTAFSISQFPFDIERVSIGEGSYGSLNVLASGSGESYLRIGRYCSIAASVIFLLQAEHSFNSLSTYPFKVKCGFEDFEGKSKGSIIIGDDVWIGFGAIICSGVKIGQGAIIGAGSVVTRDVEPYAIVAGNPARFIRYRFPDSELRHRLAKLDFSKFDKKNITKNSLAYLYQELTVNNLDSIINEFFIK